MITCNTLSIFIVTRCAPGQGWPQSWHVIIAPEKKRKSGEAKNSTEHKIWKFFTVWASRGRRQKTESHIPEDDSWNKSVARFSGCETSSRNLSIRKVSKEKVYGNGIDKIARYNNVYVEWTTAATTWNGAFWLFQEHDTGRLVGTKIPCQFEATPGPR